MERFAGRYRILKKLGHGGMGEVRLAVDLDTGAQVAIKQIASLDDTHARAQVMREFEALARVRHPAVVRAYEMSTDLEGRPYFVMEWVVGRPVDQVIVPGRTPAFAFVASRVAGGLEAVHGMGVVHGDLKPENLLVGALQPSGLPAEVRIVDFGLSNLAGVTADGHRGTPGFTAPEVVAGNPATTRSDLYSFGATLYRLATGRPAFPGETIPEILRRQANGAPSARPLEEAGFGEEWIQLIFQLLASNPNERPESATVLRRAVERLEPATRIALADRIQGESLVGRDAELGRLEKEWRRARNAARSLVAVGESGIGKSALLAAFAVRAALENRCVVRVSGSQGGAPGLTWRAVARRLATEARIDLDQVDAEIRSALAEGAENHPSSGAALQVAIAVWCRTIAAGGAAPCVLVDDADALDPLSLQMIRQLALAGADAPALWVLARRGDEDLGDEQERLMVEAGCSDRLLVPPLSIEEVARLAAARLGAEPSNELVEHLWQRAAGHPGLTVECLRAAAAGGAVREDEFGIRVDAVALTQLPLLSDFESTRVERFRASPREARRAALLLAVASKALTSDQLGRLDPAISECAVEALGANGLAVRDSEGAWCLRPAALGPRLLEELSEEDRRELHQRALDAGDLSPTESFRHRIGVGDARGALVVAEEAFRETQDAQLALEAARVAEPLDHAVSARWWTRAARSLMDRGRYRDARPHLEHALGLDADPASRGERWAFLTTCLYRNGALEDLERAVKTARGEPLDGGSQAMVSVNEAARLLTRGHAEEALAVAQAAEEMAKKAKAGAALGAAKLSQANALMRMNRLETAELCVDQALREYELAGNLVGTFRSRGMQANILKLSSRLREADGLLRSARADASSLHLRLAMGELADTHSAVLLELGRWAEAREILLSALRFALEDGRSLGTAGAMVGLAQVDGLMGSVRLAVNESRRSSLLSKRHAPAYRASVLRSAAQASRISGRVAQARRLSELAIRIARVRGFQAEIDWSVIELGRLEAVLGRWDRSLDLVVEALGRERRAGSVADVALAVIAGRASLRLCGVESASAYLAQIERWPPEAAGAYAWALTEQLRAEIALFGSNTSENEARVEDALQKFGNLPAAAEHAAAALEFARLAVKNQSAPPAAIDRWFDTASAGFRKLGDLRGRLRAQEATLDWLRALRASQPIVEPSKTLIDDVVQLLDSISDLRTLTQRAMRLAVHQFSAERGLLFLVNETTNEIEPWADFGAPDSNARRDAASYSHAVVRKAIESGSAFHETDASRKHISQSVEDLRLQSILCVAMSHNARIIGAVYLDDTRRPNRFSEDDRRLLEGFAQLMATAIVRSRGVDETRRSVEELRGENLHLRQEVESRFRPGGFVVESLSMRRLLSIVERAAGVDSNVLITGEPGTGKEHIAKALHYSGKRRSGPFVALNCGAFPEQLLESELFGHKRGAFTGAERDHDGRFIQADGGTLFLDEIGEMPLQQQVRLLRVLQERKVLPIRGREPEAFDVRIVAATNRDLRALVHEGKFRPDLYGRLNVIPIEVPPLRDHKADIPALTRHFVADLARKQERDAPKITAKFLAILSRSDWPENVRGLFNYLEKIMVMNETDTLVASPPPPDLEQREHAFPTGGGSLREKLLVYEKHLLEQALARAGGNQSEAARMLGMSEQTFRYRLRKPRTSPRPRKKRRRRK